MASIAENLRATLLSLKQISDRVKSLVTTSVTKSEATANKQAVLTAIDAAKVAIQGNDTTATLTALKTAIAALNNPTVAQIQNGLAKETQVKDGNDTAISVGKEVRSELGTGSDTAAETGTLFAVVKWVKDKVNAITGYALQGSDATATNTAIKQAILDNSGVPTMTIPDTTASQELAPNVLYIFATRTSTLTLTLGTPIVGIANEYHFFVICGSTAPTINFPAGITWNGGSAPTIAADKTYEVSILNNVAAYFEV